MQKTFTHSFEDCSFEGTLSLDTDAVLPAKVRLSVTPDGNFWLVANREGMLHLARVFAELGMGEYENGHHFHKDEQFQWSTGAPEFSFMVQHDL